MVTILPKEEDWGDIFGRVGEGFAQGFAGRSDERALQKAVEDLGPNPEPRKLLDAITKTKTYNPKAKQEFFKNALGVAEFEELQKKHRADEEYRNTEKMVKEKEKADKLAQEKNDASAIVNSSDLDDEQKQKLLDDVEKGNITYKAVKEITKPKKAEPESTFTKGLSKEHVKQYVKAEEDLVRSQRNLNDIDRVEELIDKVSGPLGYFTAANPFNEDVAELTALGFGTIEPIVKQFNPSGPIAQKKLEQLQKIYGINRFDSKAVMKGKTAALKRYAKASKELSEKRIALFEKYNGSPPIGDVVRLNAEGESFIENMLKTDPNKEITYYSSKNGRPIKDIPEDQKQQLIEQGLITDVKPGQ